MDLTLSKLKLFKPKNKKIRLGDKMDAGYVVIDGYDYDMYLTAGISDNVTFDVDFNSYRPGLKGFAFDASCARPDNLPSNYKYISKFVGANNNGFTNLEEYVGNNENIFIKMDIEGCEWEWIESFNYLTKVKQLVIECHGLFDPREDKEGWQSIGRFKYESISNALDKINKTHYLVHLHGNNAGGSFNLLNNQIEHKVQGHDELPIVVELTFIRKEDSEIDGLNDIDLPILGLDYPNYNHEIDFVINYPPIVNKNI